MSKGAIQHNEQYYKAKWRKVANVLWHSNLGVSKIAVAGSRAVAKERLDSDMDVIFAATGSPSKQELYPKLVQLMKSNFPKDKVYPGGSYNIVHLDFQSGGKFELVLLPEKQFNKEHKEDVDYRRESL
ncbi:MAG TPA: hypothetical protein VKM55_01760 [Candidatus Lokiarchaeia archaeon]|nr:hypothetical protein [Candidatus Lokiarchaeia archaeon]